MLPRLRGVLRPVLSLRAGRGPFEAGLLNHQAEPSVSLPGEPAPLLPVSALVLRRHLGTHPLKEPVEPLNSPRGAKEFIYSLHPSERTCLLRELHRFESILDIAPPTAAQLRYVLLHNALPFVGFGFLDNCIMIVAVKCVPNILTLSSVSSSAAALGNLVSDLAGLGLAGYVEALASRLGMQIPDLSPKQADMWQTRISSHSGKAIGVGIGCILGMFPLLFFNDDDKKDADKDGNKDKTQTAATAHDSK
uniref:Transmembrane protein 65 n=1 Tax=Hippocampus comes TaxID=109280 RepID=A0A3Q2XUI1_HIPCM